VLQVAGDGQGLLPGVAGLGQLASRVEGIAKVGEDLRFVEPVAEFPEDAERALVARGGFGASMRRDTACPAASPRRVAAARALRSIATLSCQWPRRYRKSAIVRGICHAWASNPLLRAKVMTPSRTWNSASNQAMAS
jgi:hypothetical protein